MKIPHPQSDCAVQQKRGRKEHIKRKHNLRKNELNNQANQFKGAATTPTHIFPIIGFWLLGITNFFLGVYRAPTDPKEYC